MKHATTLLGFVALMTLLVAYSTGPAQRPKTFARHYN